MIELCESNECTGCASCVNICPVDCIQMVPSNEGFDHPVIDHDVCTSCGLCQKVCPVITPVKFDNFENPKVYAAWNLDESVRTKSSSGGMFSVLADYVIENNGFVFGAVFDKNINVHHVGVDTKEGLNAMRGSKYVQSEIGLVFRQIKEKLMAGQKVLFVGAPCQVAGLNSYLNGKYNELIITVDFVCHGIPSPGLFQLYLKKLKSEKLIPNSKVEDFTFRDTKGWKPQISIKYNGKWEPLKRSRSIYFRLYWHNFISRESCYRCKYACVPRVSDITIADFWGLGESTPFNHDTGKGVNLLLINSANGERTFNNIKKNCFIDERTLKEATKLYNRQLTQPPKRPDLRDSIYTDFNRLTLGQIEEKYIYQFYPKKIQIAKKIKRRLARIVYPKR